MFQRSFQVATKALFVEDHTPAVLHDKLSPLLWSSKQDRVFWMDAERHVEEQGISLSRAGQGHCNPTAQDCISL